MKKVRRYFAASSGFLIALALWHWGSTRPGWNHFLLPSPGVVFARMAVLAKSGILVRHLLASMERVIAGFSISVAVAFPMGTLLCRSRRRSLVARPVLNFVRQIPPLAVVPLLILWLGIGESSRVAVVVLASFFPILLNVENGILHVDVRLLEVGRVMSFSRMDTFRHIAFPAFFPYFFVGARLALSYSWRSLIGAEIVASSSGIGYMIREAETLSRSDVIICGVITLGCIGALSDLALEALSSRLFPWSRGGEPGA